MIRLLLLAVLSGAPALVYEVVWTREVGLLAGGQIEGISVVLAAFFGGLALGTRWIGPRADRVAQPLLLFAGLEAAAGSLAIASSYLLRALGQAGVGGSSALLLSCALLLPITILLGGSLPALVRAATRDPLALGRVAGWLVGANTLGAVAGVVAATAGIPRLGLRATLSLAGLVALAIAALALALSRARAPLATERPASEAAPAPRAGAVAAAALLGVATLGYEVLATRGASLRLGSTLYAWALVLALFLAGLALGNLAAARAAARTRQPESVLGFVETAAALALALGLTTLLPALTAPASGLEALAVGAVVFAVLPPALLMGAAFPFLVRLAQPEAGHVARSFSRVSAWNTAGGIAGALLAPFVLLPALGLTHAVLACAALNALVGVAFLARGAPLLGAGGLRAGAALAMLAALAVTLQNARPPGTSARILSLEYGRQATAVVLHEGTHRTLVVDGDPEASTAGHPRFTEELLAALPMLLHPRPQRLLEVGLGAGITLGAAARFPLEQIECVEIADSVLRSARFFAPDNGDVASGRDPRVKILRGDGRAHLATRRAAFDVIVGNTLHPWAVGATGLYSREYFERIAGALGVDGIAVQWLPLQRPMTVEALTLILRTMLEVFPHGSIWWASEDLLVVGRKREQADELALLRARARDPDVAAALGALSVGDAEALASRRLVGFAGARAVLGSGPLLEDDRPRLEALSARRRGGDAGGTLELARRLAAAGARDDAAVGPLLLWLESRVARAAGDDERAGRREALAEQAGLELARRGRIAREVRAARAQLRDGRVDAALQALGRLAREAPDDAGALAALAVAAHEAGDLAASREALERLVARHPGDANAWNQLGALRSGAGDLPGAREAFERALRADPYFPEALANAGLTAVGMRDLSAAQRRLERLQAVSPLGPSQAERALRRAIAGLRPGG